MGEIKSVKVDNWGVFFLQKLQNFFNKTDYCDLTLQFRDNSQLKVHRLVLSACTDYFNVLEQTCEVIDDAIIMPNGLQADVVVPIVNFMYTGTLEFELKMYNRLLRTAKDMNMTVLLKLLEAHRRTMEMHPQKASGQTSPKPRRRIPAPASAGNSPSNVGSRSLIQINQGNKRFVSSNINAPQNRNISTSNASIRPPTSGSVPIRQIGSTTFTRIKVENEHETNSPTSVSGGYSLIKQQAQQPTSPFEQLRKGYNNNKRPTVSTFVSPPAKKPNLEDVKEFAEQQRMRKQIAAEYGDDDYDANNIMDDDTIHNDDDDDEMMTSSGQTQTAQTATSTSAGVQTMPSLSNQHQASEDPPGTTTIIVKNEGPDKPHTIVVKDNSNSKINHAKIISEVLRQYPHLVKSNKNIKLKILPNAGGQAQKIIVRKETGETDKQMQPPASKLQTAPKTSESQQQQSMKVTASNVGTNRPKTLQQESQVSQSNKSNSGITQAAISKSTATSGSSTSSTPSTAGPPQKRRIDSKTMHALIALGAENTSGPWLCLRCGRNGHPISIPSYRGFRRHLINTHKEFIDPDLCEHCGWRSKSKRELHFHMQLEHKIKTNLYIFPECQLCQQMCIDSDGLNQHLIDSHPDENKQQCIYCNKIFPEELLLYGHMKTYHKKQALEDGIIDYSDDENQTQLTLPPLPPIKYDDEMEQLEQKDSQQAKKVKIISDISLPIASSIVKTDSFVQQQESTTSAASEEYLQDQENDLDNNETKFVSADGNEVILTAEQRKEILSQLNQEHEGGSGIVMVLNDNREQQQQYSSVETHLDQDLISHDETSQATTEREEGEEEEQIAEENDQHDDNQIYNEMKSLHSNLDDSTSQTEAAAEGTNEENSLHEDEHEQEEDNAARSTEHEERVEHLEESKESIDNLEWAENLISEHDLADEVSSQTSANENKPDEKEVQLKDDDKTQDEISKKLKELTGDWSEDDDDEDMPEDPITEETKPQTKEAVKENDNPSVEAHFETLQEEEKEMKMETLPKEHEESTEFNDHEDLLASLQSTEKDESDVNEEKLEVSAADSENIEDDIDKALESLHKEVEEDDIINTVKAHDKENLSNDSEEKDCNKPIESIAEQLGNNEKEEKSISEEGTDSQVDEEKPEEKLVKELATFDEPEASSSTAEVNEEDKKDLIDTLLHEQAAIMEDTAPEIETIELEKATTENVNPDLESPLDEEKKKEDDANSTNELKTTDTDIEPTENEEFLDATPEKNKTSADNVVTTTADTSDEPPSTTETTDVDKTPISAKEDMNLSSEERVKNLISEWGDDDEDDDNDTDLAPNL